MSSCQVFFYISMHIPDTSIHILPYFHAHTFIHIPSCILILAHTSMLIPTCTYLHAHTSRHIPPCSYLHVHTSMHIAPCSCLHAHTSILIRPYTIFFIAYLHVLDIQCVYEEVVILILNFGDETIFKY